MRRAALALLSSIALSGCMTVESFGYKTADGTLFVYTRNVIPPGGSEAKQAKGMQLYFKKGEELLTVNTNHDENGVAIKEMPLGDALKLLTNLSKLIVFP